MYVSIVISEYKSVYVIKHSELIQWIEDNPKGTVLLIKTYLEI
jgi:hypothetical protein